MLRLTEVTSTIQIF